MSNNLRNRQIYLALAKEQLIVDREQILIDERQLAIAERQLAIAERQLIIAKEHRDMHRKSTKYFAKRPRSSDILVPETSGEDN